MTLHDAVRKSKFISPGIEYSLPTAAATVQSSFQQVISRVGVWKNWDILIKQFQISLANFHKVIMQWQY